MPLKTHSDDEPFTHTQHSRRAAHRSHLVKHMGAQTNDKPFPCTLLSFVCVLICITKLTSYFEGCYKYNPSTHSVQTRDVINCWAAVANIRLDKKNTKWINKNRRHKRTQQMTSYLVVVSVQGSLKDIFVVGNVYLPDWWHRKISIFLASQQLKFLLMIYILISQITTIEMV